MEFLFGLDMLRKHQCRMDLKDNVLRVGGGEVAVPFLQEKDIPPRFLDEEKYAKKASSSGAHVSSGNKERNDTPKGSGSSEVQDFEGGKVSRLVELGFRREAVTQAPKLFNGNEDQAGSFLFGS